MSKESKLSTLLQQSPVLISDLQRKSAGWFASKVSDFANVRTMREESLMSGDRSNKRNTIEPGNMYLYIYEAKHAATLPYWDRFPLVFPFSETPNGFYGLNMHYLPYHPRAALMDKLMSFASNRTMSDNTRLRFKWETISKFARFTPARVCVKQYLYTQVRSPFKRIEPQDWATALLLPMERFQSATAQEVWADSVKQLRALSR